MPKSYRLTFVRRLANWVITALARLGAPLGSTCLLTVRGRKTGVPRTTPVRLIEEEGQRWIVAPYGEVNWVQNARAAGTVMLKCRGRTEQVGIVELGPTDAAPILKKYVRQVPITRPYFDASPSASVEAFAVEAKKHPVFRVTETASTAA